MIYFLLYHCSI